MIKGRQISPADQYDRKTITIEVTGQLFRKVMKVNEIDQLPLVRLISSALEDYVEKHHKDLE